MLPVTRQAATSFAVRSSQGASLVRILFRVGRFREPCGASGVREGLSAGYYSKFGGKWPTELEV